jgi:hypothetical protein
MFRLGLCVAAAAWSCSALAHHSYAPYDQSRTIEIEGTLIDAALQNPHLRFSVEVARADGSTVIYQLEGPGLNTLERVNVPRGLLQARGLVKFAGWPSKRFDNRMYARNMLAADGQEIVLFRDAKPLWKTSAIGFGTAEAQRLFADGVATGEAGLFRVWGSDLDDFSPTFIGAPLATDAAKRAIATFDPATQSTVSGCRPKGMPLLMLTPTPIEIVDRGSTILVRTEEYDTERTIHMPGSPQADSPARSPAGHSVGRWDGRTLVVETRQVENRYLTETGVPQGPDASFVERFTPTTDGSRLDYSVTITDSTALLAPLELRRHWVSRPGEKVLPYNCNVQ